MPWILTAALAPPLVHDTDASDAVERALEAGVQDPLEPMSLDAIRAHPPELPPMADEAARVQLTHVLSAALGEGTRVHVAAPDALWTGTTGRTDWTAIPWPTVATPEPLPTAAPEPKRRPVPWHVAGAGAVVAAGGGLLAGVSNAQAQGLADDMSGATERGPYDELATRAGGANDRMRIGQGLLAGGAGIATVGVVWGVVR